MTTELQIRNFKSIKDLSISCKKLNVFIGEPNSGKSNIIEALALQSQNAIGQELNKAIFRYKTIGDLFYDFDINAPIEVFTEMKTSISYAFRENRAPENQFNFYLDKTEVEDEPIKLQHNGTAQNGNFGRLPTTDVHYYEYKRLTTFQYGYQPHLSVPFGENLPGLLLANNDYKQWVLIFLKKRI